VTYYEKYLLLHPFKEAFLCSTELESIDVALKMDFGFIHVRTLMLHKLSHAFHFLYGSINSIHGKSTLVYIKADSGYFCTCICKKYITVTALLKEETNSKTVDVTLACIN